MPESSRQHTACVSNAEGRSTDTALPPDDASNQVHVHRDRLVAIVGPTAVGKTDLAMKLARRVPVEVVGADSRQVYRHMDVGTAKPSREERASVTHHLVDITDPSDVFSLGQYIYQAKQAIRNVNATGKVPVLVGGTGQYVMALIEGWCVPAVPANPALRARLEADLAANGIASLVEELRRADPAALEAIDLKNPRRIIRAIERAAAGHPWGSRPDRVEPSFQSTIIGLSADRAQLYARADRRLDSMMENGFLAEVEWLLDAGYTRELPAMSGIGYSELADHLLDGVDLQDAVQRAKFRTHRYIRQQSSWFRASDTRINWFDVSDGGPAIDCAQSWIEASKTEI